MPTHHKDTSLRFLGRDQEDGTPGNLATAAIVHAELETAAQIERMADMLTEIKQAMAEIGQFLMTSGVLSGGIKVFNPEDN